MRGKHRYRWIVTYENVKDGRHFPGACIYKTKDKILGKRSFNELLNTLRKDAKSGCIAITSFYRM